MGEIDMKINNFDISIKSYIEVKNKVLRKYDMKCFYIIWLYNYVFRLLFFYYDIK